MSYSELSYNGQKKYEYLDKRLSLLDKVSKRTQHRCLVYGSLATIAWIAGVSKLPSITQPSSLGPYIAMLVVASSIVGTVKVNYTRAAQVNKEVKEQRKKLEKARTSDDMTQLLIKQGDFESKYAHFMRMADELQYTSG